MTTLIELKDCPKLKPCPFCGGEAIAESDEITSHSMNRAYVSSVSCTNCGCSTPNIDTSWHETVDEKSIEQWNRRECQ